MFRKSLEQKLKEIFGFKKITFDAPSDSFEQDTMFVELGDCKTRPTAEGKITAKVTGQLVVFSQDMRFTFGALAKLIEQANAEAKKDLFFFNVDTNVENSPARLSNISERRTSFVYLYSAQYDPNLGVITSLELESEE